MTIRLSEGLMQCSKDRFLNVITGYSALVVWWFAVGTARAEEDWLGQSQQIIKSIEGKSRPSWLAENPHQLEAQRQAIAIIGQSRSMVLQKSPRGDDLIPFKSEAAQYAGHAIKLVFISFSLGESALKGIFHEASGQNDVLLVLRGPKPNQKLPALFAELKTLLNDVDPLPNIVIDPVRFQRYAVNRVPDMIVEDHGKSNLRVKGITSLAWLKEYQQQGKQGDLGRLGTIYDIAEIDLLDEMKSRLAAIDWQQKRQMALARFWQERQFEILPTVSEDRDRFVKLTVTAPRDVIAPNGQLLVRAGQTVNPLDAIGFGLCLFVFDGTAQDQVNWLQTQTCTDKNARRLYLATQIPRQDGWASLKQLETALHAPVYLLTPDVRQRFQLKQVPALVEQSAKQIVIRERQVNASIRRGAS